MHTDSNFFTNEPGKALLDRFKVLIRDTRLFDVLVGYFYTSGFHALYKSLEKAEKIRILVGISTSREVFDLIQEGKAPMQGEFQFSHAESKERLCDAVVKEMENSQDSRPVEEGVRVFIEWLRSGKLEIKAYPSANIHAKVYIMTFAEGDKDAGRVITGSSNFTQAGLLDNLEFNVELKDFADYDFARRKFEELWANAVDVRDVYLDAVPNRTWLNDSVTPYELYLKFLYEYFREQVNRDQQTVEQDYLPEDFLDLEYQQEAVKDAKNKLEQYGGVFIADVVGLGKTYIAAMLAKQLDGRTLVLAPPVLLDHDNPGSWPSVLADFHVPHKCESIGKLDGLAAAGTEKFKNVIIDEAHRFRTEANVTYDTLARICRGKRVILVSATPLNNRPADILSQIKLFQKSRRSTIPNLPDLESFFSTLAGRLRGLDRQQDHDRYMKVIAENAAEIRERVLKYLIVRRTRTEIVHYFAGDLAKQGVKFPEVADPEPIFYQFNDIEDQAFSETIGLLTKRLTYARYAPLLPDYFKGKVTHPEELGQVNLQRLMKILIVKRLESSFHAFRNTLRRFIASHELFLDELGKGDVYISKKYAGKVYELLENDDDAAIQKLIDEDKAQRYSKDDFNPAFEADLSHDLAVLRKIEAMWKKVDRDPKLASLVDILDARPILKDNKLIIFTESKETAEYLSQKLNARYPGRILLYTGSSAAGVRQQVSANFDARARNPDNTYRILVATEVLSEGINLHAANVVINYDIPWNPTRLMQRAGRINRVDTKFDTIYTFNFFPTAQADDEIKLKAAAEYKIQAFIEMLGADARLLTDGEEIKSHDLFRRLTSKKTITGEDEGEASELEYLQVIRDVRDKDEALFDRIKRLPKKCRTGRAGAGADPGLVTYFRKGKLNKFYVAGGAATGELDFFAAAGLLKADKETKREAVGPDYYDLLDSNKTAFLSATTEEAAPTWRRGGRDSAAQVLKILKSNDVRNCQQFTDEDEAYIRDVIRLLEDGAIPKQTARSLAAKLGHEIKPLKILAILRTIPPDLLREAAPDGHTDTAGPREVILSEYFTGGQP